MDSHKSEPKPEIYVSVDIETDGPEPLEYSMLSLGACVVGNVTESWYREMKPLGSTFIAKAMEVNGLDWRKLLAEAPHPIAAMHDFVLWIKTLPGKPVCVTFSTWDWVFLYSYMMRFTGESPFNHSSLDMKSYYMGKFGGEWRKTSKRGIGEWAPSLLKGLPPHSHNALEDAIEQAELFRRMKDDWQVVELEGTVVDS